MKAFMSFLLFLTITVAPNKADNEMISDEITVCHGLTAPEEFALFTQDPDFMSAHEAPRPVLFADMEGESITFKTSGEDGKGYFIKAERPTDNYLFVIHEWWGLNDNIREMAQKLADDLGNINVLAIDLYDGQVTDKAQEAGKLMSGVKTERAEAIIEGAMNYAGNSAKILTVGWCFGGGWSLQASLLAGSQARGAVMYYGMPEKDVEKLKTLEVDVLGIWATERWINADVIAQFEKNMKEAGKTLISHTYKSNHAFANPSQPSYNEADATDAYAKTLSFLKERIQ